jgi:hypothetical protein
MLPKLQKTVLDYIIKFWKVNNGKLLTASIVNEDYKKLKEDIHKKINKEINDNYLLTALKYLSDAGYLYEKINESEITSNTPKYSPTPKGIDMSKYWLCREENLKWLLTFIISIIALIISIIVYFQK